MFFIKSARYNPYFGNSQPERQYNLVNVSENVTGFTKTILIGTRNEIQFIADY